MIKHRYSHLMDYLKCPRFYELKNLLGETGPGPESSALYFGSALHLGIEAYFKGIDGRQIFQAMWECEKDKDLLYYGMHNWNVLMQCGLIYMERFKKYHLKKFKPFLLEKRQEVNYNGHILGGTPDFLGDFQGVPSVVDWKTSSHEYPKEKLLASPQMFGYNYMARVNENYKPKQHVYVVFIKPDHKKFRQQGMDALSSLIRIQIITQPVTEIQVAKRMEEVGKLMAEVEQAKEFRKNYNSCLWNNKNPCEMWSHCYAGDDD